MYVHTYIHTYVHIILNEIKPKVLYIKRKSIVDCKYVRIRMYTHKYLFLHLQMSTLRSYTEPPQPQPAM